MPLSGLVSAVRVQTLLCFAHRQLPAAPLLHGQGPFHDHRGSHHQGNVTAGLGWAAALGREAPGQQQPLVQLLPLFLLPTAVASKRQVQRTKISQTCLVECHPRGQPSHDPF